jgi:hypothetical protein
LPREIDSTLRLVTALLGLGLFGEIKPYSGSLKDGRLDLVYYRDPGLTVGDQFPLWKLN